MNGYDMIGLISMLLTLISGIFQNSELVLSCGIIGLYCAIKSIGYRVKTEESEY